MNKTHMFCCYAPTPQKAMEAAIAHLEKAKNACDANDPELASKHCGKAKAALLRIKNPVREDLMSSPRDKNLCNGIADTYFELGELLDSLDHNDKAQDSYTYAQLWGRSTIPPISEKDMNQPSDLNKGRDPAVMQITPHIFVKDMIQPPGINELPRVQDRLKDVSQLVHCLDRLQSLQSTPEDELDQSERDWLNAIKYDTDEQERLKTLAIKMVREFSREGLKDAHVVAEVVCLVPVLQKPELQELLQRFFHGVEQSKILDFNLLEGLAQLVQRAPPEHLHSDDLVKILELISTRLRGTHEQSPDYIRQLSMVVSHVLDAMADSKVGGLDRENLHAPLAEYLKGLKDNDDLYLVYQAAYASQALLYVPDDETPWQATMRRTGKVVKGVSGLVSAVKGLDLNGFVEGLDNIQKGMSGLQEVFTLAKTAVKDVSALAESGQQFVDCLKEGISFSRKRVWYPALRGADIFLRNGQLIDFERLVCEAPCRQDPAFQWGVCQRLGELAANPECDDESRKSAVAFLGEMYRNDAVWGRHTNIKQLILDILLQLAALTGSVKQVAKTLLKELEKDGDAEKRTLYQAYHKKTRGPHPLKVALPPSLLPSLLDRVQSRVDVEASLRQLKAHRLSSELEPVYIPPQAMASIDSSGKRFFLMDKVKEFLRSDQKVFLLSGDSGAGKSTFNQQLEHDLWTSYKKIDGRIPLFIDLTLIQNPEHDMIAKQLKEENFTEPQIQELKLYREFILICEGYDESRQTHNLYKKNQLNQPGRWRAQMVISCRSEYLGPGYQDSFQPYDRKHRAEPFLFQEAVIAPFSWDQIAKCVKESVLARKLQWEADDYLKEFDRILSLKELVTNPFLLTLSLDVLPRMADREGIPSAGRITRVTLYDESVEKWLDHGKEQHFNNLQGQDWDDFVSIRSDFNQRGVKFLKDLATAIYKNQPRDSVVSYSPNRDNGTWKREFFDQERKEKFLREACPLKRNGQQYRFLHRSLLEYSLARAVFEPQEEGDDQLTTVEPTVTGLRRGGSTSAYSSDSQGDPEEVRAVEQLVLKSPLGWKNFVEEPSVMQFLVERVQQGSLFKSRLVAVIEKSKTAKTDLEAVRMAAANAISILVRAGVKFDGADLRGIKIPGADLSHAIFELAKLQEADMEGVNLQSTSLRGANLSGAKMTGVQFGESPYLEEGHAVASCEYSPNGRTFAVGLGDGNISIYTTSNWEKTRTLSGHGDSIRGVVYSPEGDLIASGSSDKTVRLWDIETGDCRHILSGHTDCVVSVVYSPNGDRIASGSDDFTVRLWNVETGVCLRTLSGHMDGVVSVVYSPKGDQIASGSLDKTVRLWDVKSGDCRHTLKGHSRRVSSLAYSPDGEQIASGSHDNTVRLWDTTGECLHILSGHSDRVSNVVYSPKGDQIASASDDNTVLLWDIGAERYRHTLTGHSNGVVSIAYSPKGDQIASGSDDETVRLWDVTTGDCHNILTGDGGYVSSVMYSPKGDQIAFGSSDNTVRMWGVGTGSANTLASHGRSMLSVVYSPEGDHIASGGWDKTVQLWDVQGRLYTSLGGHGGIVRSVVYSPNGDRIASSSDDKTVRLWDVKSGDCRHTLKGHTDCVVSVAYSPKGGQIASGSADKTVRLWDIESGDCCYALEGHADCVASVVYSPKGDQIASGSNDKTVRLWDVESGDCRHTLGGHSDIVRSVVYSPKGDQIASGSDDKTVRLWDVTGKCIHALFGHSQGVTSVVYSPEGNQIASGSWDETVRVWDISLGTCQLKIQNHGKVNSIAWKLISHGHYVVVGSANGTIQLWDVIEDEEEEGGLCHAQLNWRSPSDSRVLVRTSIQDVQGLSPSNKQLLMQYGAIGEPKAN